MTPRGAYFFNTGCNMTMIGCGSEFANNTDVGIGSIIGGLANNKLTILGYKGVPVANQTQPLISIGDNSSYYIQNWDTNQASYPNSLDISVNGDNSVIVIENSIFSGGRFLPVVQFRGEHATSFVIVKWKGNEYIYKSPVGGGTVTTPEFKFRSASFTPALRVDNAASNITYSNQVADHLAGKQAYQTEVSIPRAGRLLPGLAPLTFSVPIAGLSRDYPLPVSWLQLLRCRTSGRYPGHRQRSRQLLASRTGKPQRPDFF